MHRSIESIMGNTQKLDGGAMFGNCPRAVWERWMVPDELGRIPLACRALLVVERGRNLLFETGIGAFFEPSLRQRYGVQEDEHVLLASLAAQGLGHEDIDVVVLSHLHFDHAGGLLAAWEEGAPLRLLFPKARYLVGEQAFARARAPHPRDRASFIPGLCDLLEESGRLEIAREETHPLLGEDFKLHYSDGHTPGLMMSEVPTESGPLLFASDLIPAAPWMHLPITMGYDRYPELLIDEKKALLSDLLDRGGSIFFTHDPHLARGRVAKDDKGRFRAEPAAA